MTATAHSRSNAKISLNAHKSEALNMDPQSQLDYWQSLPEHLTDVETAMREILKELGLSKTPEGEALLLATRWHDRGKSLKRWQQAVLDHVRQVAQKCELILQDPISSGLRKHIGLFEQRMQHPEGTDILWAKWPDVRRVWQEQKLKPEFRALLNERLGRQFRPGLRHEAASALAAWNAWVRRESGLTGLSVFLIASHHGKVRTVLRSTSSNDEIFGLQKGDVLPPISGLFDLEAELPFDIKQIGASGEWIDDETFAFDQPSWIAMITELLGTGYSSVPDTFDAIPKTEPRNLGPFKLAYLEALLRAADARASRWPKGGRE